MGIVIGFLILTLDHYYVTGTPDRKEIVTEEDGQVSKPCYGMIWQDESGDQSCVRKLCYSTQAGETTCYPLTADQ